jgi:hypothetical protein
VSQVQPAATVAVQVNVAKLNAILTQLGARTTLPSALGSVPLDATVPETAVTTTTTGGVRYALVEMTRPTLDVPAGIPTQAIWQDLVSLPFLPADVRAAWAGESDWRDTLVLPLPGQAENVEFLGHQAIVDVGPHGHLAVVAWLAGNALLAFGEAAPATTLTPTGFLAQASTLLTP